MILAGPPGDDLAPAWIAVSLAAKEGRDPLGLQTTTQDRLMPVLLPGLLELTRRARYFSFYAFLLQEYRDRRVTPDPKAQSAFILRHEWDLGLAVQRCPLRCGSSPVGSRRLGATALGAGPFPRGESVESAYGGYGLYYRSPMIQTGLVARTGTLLGDQPIPVDVLRPTPRAQALADRFREAVQDTAYYKDEFTTSTDLPADVVDELAATACLCRLMVRPDERSAVHAALFDWDDDDGASAVAPEEPTATAVELPVGSEVAQRRRSVAHYLTLLDADHAVAVDEGAYREALWNSAGERGPEHAAVAGQWAALVAKDVWQDALCSVWSAFCDEGVSTTRALGGGLDWAQAREAAGRLCSADPALDPAMPTAELAAAVAARQVVMRSADGHDVDPRDQTLEQLRDLTDRLDTATSGLVVLLELARRAAERGGSGWNGAAGTGSAWQPSVATVLDGLRAHLDTGPSVGDTLWWLVRRFVVPVHERIAYSKLPEFTFRFRWEDGLLRFYDHGPTRFPLAAIRNQPLALLTRDLGMWRNDDQGNAALTDVGTAFVAECLR